MSTHFDSFRLTSSPLIQDIALNTIQLTQDYVQHLFYPTDSGGEGGKDDGSFPRQIV